MVEKKTIANIITAAIWIGSLIFLIWFCVVQFQRLKRTSVVTTSFSSPESIVYPGLFICPATETVQKTVAGSSVFVGVGNGATFQPFKPFDANPQNAGVYSVCPRFLWFNSPNGVSVGCIDFQPAPVYNASATMLGDDNFCVDTNSQAAYWYKSSNTVPNPAAVWTATSVGNGMYIDLNSENIISEPYMVLLYSPNTQLQPPTSWATYQAMFSLTNFFLAHIPLMAFVQMNLDKIITDNWPIDNSCSYEGFLSAVDTFTSSPPPMGTFRVSSMLMGFDILEEVTTCHSAIVGGTDVLGIVGGGVALVLAVTIGFQLLVQRLLGEKQESNVQGGTSTYRPLSGE